MSPLMAGVAAGGAALWEQRVPPGSGRRARARNRAPRAVPGVENLSVSPLDAAELPSPGWAVRILPTSDNAKGHCAPTLAPA